MGSTFAINIVDYSNFCLDAVYTLYIVIVVSYCFRLSPLQCVMWNLFFCSTPLWTTISALSSCIRMLLSWTSAYTSTHTSCHVLCYCTPLWFVFLLTSVQYEDNDGYTWLWQHAVAVPAMHTIHYSVLLCVECLCLGHLVILLAVDRTKDA